MDYFYLVDIWYNVFLFSVKSIPKYRLVCQNWNSMIDDSKTLQQKVASIFLNNNKRKVILNQNLPIYSKLHLLLDGLPLNNKCIMDVIKNNKNELLNDYFQKKSFVKIVDYNLENVHFSKQHPILDLLFNNSNLETLQQHIPILKKLCDNLNIMNYFDDNDFVWHIIRSSDEFRKVFGDCDESVIKELTKRIGFDKSDEFLTLVYCLCPDLFKRLCNRKVGEQSNFINFLNGSSTLESIGILDERVRDCIVVLIEHQMNDLLTQIAPRLTKANNCYLGLLNESIVNDCAQSVINSLWEVEALLIDHIVSFKKDTIKNTETIIRNREKFTPGAFNVVLLRIGNFDLIEHYLDKWCSTVVKNHLYAYFSESNQEIDVTVCEHIFDHYPSIFREVKNFNDFYSLISNKSHPWYHKRGRITQLVILRTYKDYYDHFLVDELDLAEFFYDVIGKRYDKHCCGKYSLPYFVIHYPDIILKDACDVWTELNFWFCDFDSHNTLILNQLEKMSVPVNFETFYWPDIGSREAIDWFLERGFPLKTKTQLETFLLLIITCDAHDLFPVFERNFIRYKQGPEGDKKLTIFPLVLNDILNFDIFQKLCQLGVIETPTTLDYSLNFNYDFIEIVVSDDNDSDDTKQLLLSPQQLYQLKMNSQ